MFLINIHIVIRQHKRLKQEGNKYEQRLATSASVGRRNARNKGGGVIDSLNEEGLERCQEGIPEKIFVFRNDQMDDSPSYPPDAYFGTLSTINFDIC